MTTTTSWLPGTGTRCRGHSSPPRPVRLCTRFGLGTLITGAIQVTAICGCSLLAQPGQLVRRAQPVQPVQPARLAPRGRLEKQVKQDKQAPQGRRETPAQRAKREKQERRVGPVPSVLQALRALREKQVQ